MRSNFGTQHAKQEIERRPERHGFPVGFAALTVLILLLLALFIFPAINGMLARANTFRQVVEMHRLEFAIESYVSEVGEPPPKATLANIEIHVRESGHLPTSSELNLDNFTHDLETLDDRETAWFWLGGNAWQSISSAPDRKYFDFSTERLTDVDGDGWPEYTDRMGNFFILRNGKIVLQNITTQKEYTIEDLQNNVGPSKSGE